MRSFVQGGMVVASPFLHHAALPHMCASLMQNAYHARARYFRLRLWARPRHTVGDLAGFSPRPFPMRDRVVGVMPLRTGPEAPAALRWMEARRSPTLIRACAPSPRTRSFVAGLGLTNSTYSVLNFCGWRGLPFLHGL